MLQFQNRVLADNYYFINILMLNGKNLFFSCCTRQACKQKEDRRCFGQVRSGFSRRQVDRSQRDHLGSQDGQSGGEASPAVDRHSAQQAAGIIQVCTIWCSNELITY